MTSPPLPPTFLPYRMDLQYLGSPFTGWQSQPQGSGVQDHLEKALAVILRHPVRLIGASRTDTGVHAEQQVALLRTDQPYDERRWLKSLHGLLPPAIGIARIVPAAADFHPIYSAKGKTYRYRLWTGQGRNPLTLPFCWPMPYTLDLTAMRSALADFVGVHDFTSFCAVDSAAKTRTRHVLETELHGTGPLIELWITGRGFLKQMVRNIVGTVVDVGRGKRDASCVPGLLAARDRRAAGLTAPAPGLSLVQIYYDDIPPLALLRAQLATGFAVKCEP